MIYITKCIIPKLTLFSPRPVLVTGKPPPGAGNQSLTSRYQDVDVSRGLQQPRPILGDSRRQAEQNATKET